MSKYTKRKLEKAAKDSISVTEIVRKVTGKERVHGSMWKYIKDLLVKYEIDLSHLKGKSHGLGKNGFKHTKTTFKKTYLKKDSPQINSNRLKNYLWKFGFLEERCEECQNSGIWNGKILTLQIDHINGKHLDNRLSNLRILCPNCHSQTVTYAGKNNRE